MRIRKKDYIISFVFFLLLFVLSITPINGVIAPLFKSLLAALLGALILGTLTNLLIKKKVIE